ncbi:MAG: hypothetical protein U0103_15820 [Candidatus Obscuribacterales bacterium]
MFNNKVAGNFDKLEDAKSLLDDLTKRRFHIPASEITVKANVTGRYEYCDQNYLNRLFTAWMVLGALVGVGYTLQFLQPVGVGATILAALSFGITGAALGQLVAGLSDVVFNGSLDDRLDIEEPTLYTISATVPNEIEPAIEAAMKESGAVDIHNLVA